LFGGSFPTDQGLEEKKENQCTNKKVDVGLGVEILGFPILQAENKTLKQKFKKETLL